jgi:hypothetical protein
MDLGTGKGKSVRLITISLVEITFSAQKVNNILTMKGSTLWERQIAPYSASWP